MQYKVVAYNAKVGSVIDLAENVTIAGVIYPASSNEMFIVCLEPVEDKRLPMAELEEEAEEAKIAQ